VRLWLNGQHVHAEGAAPAPEAEDARVSLALRPGWNTLHVRVELAGGPGRLWWRLADETSERVRDLADRGRWEEAAGRAAEAVARHPGRRDLLVLAARTARRHADHLRQQGLADQAGREAAQARSWYETLRGLRPDDPSLAEEFADLLLSWQRGGEVPAGTGRWRNDLPALDGGRARLAAAHILRGEWAAALGLLEASAAPTAGEQFLLALACTRLGRHEEAKRSFTAAVAAMGKAPAREALLSLAVEVVSSRLERETKDTALLLQRARWYVDLGGHTEAVADFTHVLELDGRNLPALLERGECYARLGLAERAAADDRAARGMDRAAALAWHRRQSAAPERDRGDVLAKVLHLDEVIDAEHGQPAEAGLLLRRGELRGRLGQWQQAADDFARALELDAQEHWNWYTGAVLRWQVGDGAGYRRQCREMLRRFGETSDPHTAERIAKTCTLTPDGPAADPRTRQLAERATAGPLAERGYWWSALARGMVEYRTGHYQAAIDWLVKGREMVGKELDQEGDGPNRENSLYCRTLIELFLALAHAQRREAGPAREALGRATKVMDRQLPPEGGDLGLGWQDWLQCRMIRREVEALLRGPTPGGKP
jgi:tetratricopeptide (TPR) repeat protein